MKLIPKITPTVQRDEDAEAQRTLLRQEAKVGGQLFGGIPAGHDREFFCLDNHTWIWHEQWLDEKGRRQAITTRYDVRPSGVIKIQDGQPHRKLDINEAANLFKAVQLYQQRVGSMYQQMLQAV